MAFFKNSAEQNTTTRGAVMAKIFLTAANFFQGNGRTPWDKITTEQTEQDPWVNYRGVEVKGVRGKMMAA